MIFRLGIEGRHPHQRPQYSGFCYAATPKFGEAPNSRKPTFMWRAFLLPCLLFNSCLALSVHSSIACILRVVVTSFSSSPSSTFSTCPQLVKASATLLVGGVSPYHCLVALFIVIVIFPVLISGVSFRCSSPGFRDHPLKYDPQPSKAPSYLHEAASSSLNVDLTTRGVFFYDILLAGL